MIITIVLRTEGFYLEKCHLIPDRPKRTKRNIHDYIIAQQCQEEMNLTGTLHKNGVILHEIFDKSENNFTLLPQLPDCVTKPKRRVFLLLTNLTTHPRVLPQTLPYFCDPCRNSTVMFDKVLRHHGCIGLYHSCSYSLERQRIYTSKPRFHHKEGDNHHL